MSDRSGFSPVDFSTAVLIRRLGSDEEGCGRRFIDHTAAISVSCHANGLNNERSR
jgi:hypothetical protein